jgi:hypothetical protein
MLRRPRNTTAGSGIDERHSPRRAGDHRVGRLLHLVVLALALHHVRQVQGQRPAQGVVGRERFPALWALRRYRPSAAHRAEDLQLLLEPEDGPVTVVARRPERGVTPLVGEEVELRAYLAGLIAAGQLRGDGLVASGRLADGRCWAKVRLLPLPPRPVLRREVSPNLVAAGLVTATVLVAAAWVVFLASHIAVVAVVVVAALLAWVGLGQVGVCPGLHCPGCKHR